MTHAEPPPPEWKFSLFFNPSTQGGSAHVLRSTFHVSRPSLRVLWLTGQLRRQKLLAQENLFHFFENFSKYFGILNGENTLFSKSAQKMV